MLGQRLMDDEIEITHDMLQAGLRALDEAKGAYGEEDTVRAIYRAMAPLDPWAERFQEGETLIHEFRS